MIVDIDVFTLKEFAERVLERFDKRRAAKWAEAIKREQDNQLWLKNRLLPWVKPLTDGQAFEKIVEREGYLEFEMKSNLEVLATRLLMVIRENAGCKNPTLSDDECEMIIDSRIWREMFPQENKNAASESVPAALEPVHPAG